MSREGSAAFRHRRRQQEAARAAEDLGRRAHADLDRGAELERHHNPVAQEAGRSIIQSAALRVHAVRTLRKASRRGT